MSIIPQNLKLKNIDKYNVDMSFVEEANKHILEKRMKLIKDIDNTIRKCIKKEIKKYGSIIKRYNSWKEFIKDNITDVSYQGDGHEIHHIFYRGEEVITVKFDFCVI